MEYIFTLKYQLAESDCNHDELVERLIEGGCDDAIIGIGQPGRIALEFTRESSDARSALLSAMANVKAAIPTAKLIEAAPDFVGLTEVGEVVGVTRQNMRKLWVMHVTTFPTPVHEGSATVWHLADILIWLQTKGTYNVEPTLMEVAKTAKQINVAKEAAQLLPGIQPQVQPLIT